MSAPGQPKQPEAWLSGPVAGIDPWLQPVAHALVQAREDVVRAVSGLAAEAFAARPGGAASLAFHLRHIPGSTDRLITYAAGAALDESQKARLAAEKEEAPVDPQELVASFELGIDAALRRLQDFRGPQLLEPREVGRARLPSTVLGLLFHAAEHAQRHAGQVIATAKVLRGDDGPDQSATPSR